jgi:hypothetical protein
LVFTDWIESWVFLLGFERLWLSTGSLDWLFFWISGLFLLQDVGFSYSVLSKILEARREVD